MYLTFIRPDSVDRHASFRIYNHMLHNVNLYQSSSNWSRYYGTTAVGFLDDMVHAVFAVHFGTNLLNGHVVATIVATLPEFEAKPQYKGISIELPFGRYFMDQISNNELAKILFTEISNDRRISKYLDDLEDETIEKTSRFDWYTSKKKLYNDAQKSAKNNVFNIDMFQKSNEIEQKGTKSGSNGAYYYSEFHYDPYSGWDAVGGNVSEAMRILNKNGFTGNSINPNGPDTNL